MYTQCPECLSVFSLDAQTLAKANGHAVCGHCNAGFDSLATLSEQLPPEPFVEMPLNEPALEPPLLDLVVYRPQLQAAVQVVADGVAGTGGADTATGDFADLVFAPRFTREPKASRPRSARTRHGERVYRPRTSGDRTWPWAIACVVLAALLGCQIAWAKRDVLIRDPAVGNWLRSSCATLGCQLPLVAAPQQLRLLASNVQVHPTVPGALMISASVRNEAGFAQPYPVLTISLSNAAGDRIAMRRLQPAAYLDDDSVRQQGLPPGGSAVLLLEVEDPGEKAVAFEIGFE